MIDCNVQILFLSKVGIILLFCKFLKCFVILSLSTVPIVHMVC